MADTGIRMVCEKRHHKGKPDVSYPAVFCDVCGERIEKAVDGNVYWNPTFDSEKDAFYGSRWAVVFTHKGCSRDGGAESVDRMNLFWQPLEHFVVFLGRNLGVPVPSKSADVFGSI